MTSTKVLNSQKHTTLLMTQASTIQPIARKIIKTSKQRFIKPLKLVKSK